MTSRLELQLKSLKLTNILAHYQAEAQVAAQPRLSYEDFLARLVDLEAVAKLDRRINARIVKDRFPTLKTMEDFRSPKRRLSASPRWISWRTRKISSSSGRRAWAKPTCPSPSASRLAWPNIESCSPPARTSWRPRKTTAWARLSCTRPAWICSSWMSWGTSPSPPNRPTSFFNRSPVATNREP